jgi:opacity protein-like surface antigen
VQYNPLSWLTLGAAYEFVDLGDADLNLDRGPLAGVLTGSYSSNHLNVLTVYATLRL